MSALTLRCRLPSGQTTISIAPTATHAELVASIAEAAGLDGDGLKIISGFPPKPLVLEEGAPISSVLQNMDTLSVSVSAPEGGQAASYASILRTLRDS